MPRKKLEEWERAPLMTFVYVGVRWARGKLRHHFERLDADTWASCGEWGERVWQHKPGQPAFNIGSVYAGRCTEDGNVWFHTFELQRTNLDNADTFTDSRAKWSLLDAAARLEKAQVASLKRVNRERRDEWRKCMAPIRAVYAYSNATDRRAIRTLLIDDLLRG